MIKETEPVRFRSRKSTGRPYGGNIADEPFPRVLHCLAVKKGYGSQLALTKALGKKYNCMVGTWYRGEHVPLPKEFGNLLVVLKPNDEELDLLVESYAQLLTQRREKVVRISSMATQPTDNPFGQWVENICRQKKISISEFFRILGFSKTTTIRRKPGKETLNSVVENAPRVLNLSEEEIESLSQAVSLEIEKRVAEGHRFQDNPRGSKLKKMQKEINHSTYNGAQAANKLGVTRERVRQLRKKFKFPLLLTEEHLEMLGARLGKTKQ